MKWSFAAASLALFVVSILFLFLLTLFESSLTNMSVAAERLVSAILLVLPGVIGVILGVMSVLRKEAKRWMALLGILLNALFALFHVVVLAFAG
jgi:hypothetical protein